MSGKIGFVTPPKAASQGPSLSQVEKQRLMENLELELQDRTRHFHGALADILNSFLVRQESEILRIPKDLRNVKMKDLKSMWGGDWASTLRHLKEETLKGKTEGDQSAQDNEIAKVPETLESEGNDDKRKRKRPIVESRSGSVETPVGRRKKSARRAAETPTKTPVVIAKTPGETRSRFAGFLGSKLSRPLLASPNTLTPTMSSPFKRFGMRATPTAASTASPSKPSRFAGFKLPTISSLSRTTTKNMPPAPVARTFQPIIPAITPKFPRQLKDTDVVLSANGSPIANPWTARKQQAETSEDENELPDPEALEMAMMARATPRFEAGPSRLNRPVDLPRYQVGRKRISSIRIRQSISIGQPEYYDPFVDATPRRAHIEKPSDIVVGEGKSPARISSRGAMLRLTTSSGLTIDFDPFTDDPEMVEEELLGKGVDEDVRGQVRSEMAKKVKELRERLASFKI